MSKPTLIVGYKGQIGTRYQAVFNYLKAPWIGVDIDCVIPDPNDYGDVLVCVPTDYHFNSSLFYAEDDKRVLCEKPISMEDGQIESLIKTEYKISMVNNWWWAIKIRFGHMPRVKIIEYNYYNTGKDGMAWDCIQPIFIADRVIIKTDSPVFQCHVNGQELTRFFFDASYVEMIKAWLAGDNLWTLEQALEANQKVRQYVDSNSST